MLPTKVARGKKIYASDMNGILAKLREIKTEPTNTKGLKAKTGISQTSLGVGESSLNLPAYSLVAMDKIAAKDDATINDVLGNRAVKIRQVATGEVTREYVGNQIMTWADPFHKIGISQDNMTGGQPVEVITSGISICRLVRSYSDNYTEDFEERWRYAVPQCGSMSGTSGTNRNALVSSPIGTFEILWEEPTDYPTLEHFAIVKFHVPIEPGAMLAHNGNNSSDAPAWSAVWMKSYYSGVLGCLPIAGFWQPGDDNIPAAAVAFTGENGIKVGKTGIVYSAFDRLCRVTTEDNSRSPGPFYSWGTVKDSYKLKAGNRGFTSATLFDMQGETVWVRPFDQSGICYKQAIYNIPETALSPTQGGWQSLTQDYDIENGLEIPGGLYLLHVSGLSNVRGHTRYVYGFANFSLVFDDGTQLMFLGHGDGRISTGSPATLTGGIANIRGDTFQLLTATKIVKLRVEVWAYFTRSYNEDGSEYIGPGYGTCYASFGSGAIRIHPVPDQEITPEDQTGEEEETEES